MLNKVTELSEHSPGVCTKKEAWIQLLSAATHIAKDQHFKDSVLGLKVLHNLPLR